MELRRFEESIDRGIEVQKDRGTEESPALVVRFHRWCVSILPLSRRTREDRETVVVSIGGGFEPFFRTVVVSIGGGSVVVWRIGGGSGEDRWWFLSVEDRSMEDRW